MACQEIYPGPLCSINWTGRRSRSNMLITRWIMKQLHRQRFHLLLNPLPPEIFDSRRDTIRPPATKQLDMSFQRYTEPDDVRADFQKPKFIRFFKYLEVYFFHLTFRIALDIFLEIKYHFNFTSATGPIY